MWRTSQAAWRIAPRASRATLVSQRLPIVRPIPASFQPRPLSQSPVFVLQATRRLASSSSNPPPRQPGDQDGKKEVAKESFPQRPGEVSVESSTRQVLESGTKLGGAGEHDMAQDLKNDLNTVKETFRLSAVPRESYLLGLAGTIPYLATSISTVFLSWNANQQLPTSSNFLNRILFDHDTAHSLLGIIEPIQLGYGAVIISFLGAIHWGLEFAEKQPLAERTRFRYGIGLAASLVAWPTVIMPIEYALTTQFMAFVGLYFADSRASTRGWAPSWYGTYRFVLTGVVGIAIFISLVGRARIGEGNRLSTQGLSDSLSAEGIADHHTDWAKLEAEEKKRIKKEKQEAEKKAKKEAQAKKKEGGGEKGQGKGAKQDDNEKEKDESDVDSGKEDSGKEEKEDEKQEDDKGGEDGSDDKDKDQSGGEDSKADEDKDSSNKDGKSGKGKDGKK